MNIRAIVLACFILGAGSAWAQSGSVVLLPAGEAQTSLQAPALSQPLQDNETLSGNYLSSLFAQRHHDWGEARGYLDDVLKKTPDDPQLLKRAMVLAVGSGEMETGFKLAKRVSDIEEKSALALMFLATQSFHEKHYKEALQYLSGMPDDSLSQFLTPLLRAWTQAATGVNDTKGLNKNIIHIHHAVLIADHLHNYSPLETLLKSALDNPDLTASDLGIIADIYAHIGDKDKAIALYEKVIKDLPDDKVIPAKIAALKEGKPVKLFAPVKSAEEGMSLALDAMSQLLYKELADDSARVFANLALYLDPSLADGNLLLAAITARNERYDEAIGYYRKIPESSPYFLEARRQVADLLMDSGRQQEALNELHALVRDRNDLESRIKTGDIYRQSGEFDKALTSYNEAAAKLGDNIPAQYWYLHYVRGMSYERAGQWDKAERDLKAALAFQPDHPFILNYLGYAWAEQGVNLSEALDMVSRAAMLQPDDGYITDFLGWVYYRLGRYGDSVGPLEKAVQLLPYDPTVNDHLGDAYWQAGRKREARFQWQRAQNLSKDEELIAKLGGKLEQGLQAAPVKEARSQAATDPVLSP